MLRVRLGREKAAALIIALMVVVLSTAFLGLIYRAVNLALLNSRMRFYTAQAQELAQAGAAVAMAKMNKNPAYQDEEISLAEGSISISVKALPAGARLRPDKKQIKVILCSAVFPRTTKKRRKAAYRLILLRDENFRWKVQSSSFK